jgi:hypothetical protein
MQFSLRALLALTAVFALWLGVWLKPRLDRAERQRRVVNKIVECGGAALYIYREGRSQSPYVLSADHPDPIVSTLVRQMLGHDFFDSVYAVNLDSAAVSDDWLATLESLPSLHEVTLKGTEVTDAGLVHLAELRGLTKVDLTGTRVTELGVNELREALPRCNITR